MPFKLYTDGGARGNPGPAAIGAVLFNENNELAWFDGKYVGENTNNYAEYMAIIHGLTYFIKTYGNTPIVCHLDSELVVKQLNGEYKVKNEVLKDIHTRVKELIKSNTVEFKHIYRENNKFADKLVNICLDARL